MKKYLLCKNFSETETKANKKAIGTMSIQLNRTATAINVLSSTLKHSLSIQMFDEAVRDLQREFGSVEETVEALSDIIFALPHNQLHPGISRFFAIAKGWNVFRKALKKRKLEPVFSDMRHLVNTPMSYGFKEQGTLVIDIHVPVTGPERKLWKVYEWGSLPWLHKEAVFEVEKPNEVLAVRGDVMMSIPPAELARVHKVGGIYIWDRATIASEEPTSCLSAIWKHNYRTAAKLCHLTGSKYGIRVWGVNSTTFLTTLGNSSKISVECGEGSDSELISGTKMITVHDGNCTVWINRELQLKPARKEDHLAFRLVGAPSDWMKDITVKTPKDIIPDLKWSIGTLDGIYKQAELEEYHRWTNTGTTLGAMALGFIAILLICISCCVAKYCSGKK